MKTTLLFTASLLLSTLLHSQVLLQTNFESLNSNASLDDQNGWSHDTSNGGTGSNFGVASEASQIVDFALSYQDYGSSMKSLESDNAIDSDGPGKFLSAPVTSGTYYLGFVVNVSSAPNAQVARDVIRMLNGGAFNTSSRVFVQAGTTGFNLGIKIGGPNTPAAVVSQEYAYNQNHLIIIKYEIIDGSSNDVMEVFINPDYATGEPSTPSATAPVSSFEASNNIDRLAFPWNVPSNSRFGGHVGLVSVARNWMDLTTLSTPVENKKLKNLKYFTDTQDIHLGMSRVGTLSVYSLDGKKIIDYEVSNQRSVRTGQLDQGMYIARFQDKEGTNSVLKFIVN